MLVSLSIDVGDGGGLFFSLLGVLGYMGPGVVDCCCFFSVWVLGTWFLGSTALYFFLSTLYVFFLCALVLCVFLTFVKQKK